jgi:hypothetical protein
MAAFIQIESNFLLRFSSNKLLLNRQLFIHLNKCELWTLSRPQLSNCVSKKQINRKLLFRVNNKEVFVGKINTFLLIIDIQNKYNFQIDFNFIN